MGSLGKPKKETLVEEGTEFQGTLKSSCPVMVNGSLDGNIEAPALTITGTGKVLGTVKVEELKSDGTLAGNIDAEKVSLSGTVHSDTVIRAKSLEVKLAPERGKLEVTFGEVNLDVGDEPSASDEASDARAKSEPPVEQPEAAAAKDADDEAPEEAPANGSSSEMNWSQPPAD